MMQAMAKMLPTLGLTAACLEQRLCSPPQSEGDCLGVTEAAELDAAIDAIKVSPYRLRPAHTLLAQDDTFSLPSTHRDAPEKSGR